MKKACAYIILITIFTVFAPFYTYADPNVVEVPDIKVVIDGKITTYDDVPIMINDRTMLPLRALLVNLGFKNDDQHIIWDNTEKSVTIVNDSVKIRLIQGSNIAYVNDSPVPLEAAPTVYGKNWRTYIPARFVAYALNKDVQWDDATRTVIINSIGNNVIRVGLDDCFPPMEFKDGNGGIEGFDIDLTKEICKRLNMKTEFVSTSWDGIFAGLNNNKYDCIISAVCINEPRKQFFLFTKPYIKYTQTIVTNKSNLTINSLDDINGKTIGVQGGSTAQDICENSLKDKNLTLKKYDSSYDMISDLKSGKIDAAITDNFTARYTAIKDNDLKVIDAVLSDDELIGICFKSTGTELKGKVERVLDDMRNDGTLKSISIKWFGADLTSNIE